MAHIFICESDPLCCRIGIFSGLFQIAACGCDSYNTSTICMPLFLMAGLLTRLAVIPAIVSFTIATKVTIGKDLTSPALPYLFGLIAIFIVGSGLYSVDYWLLYALAGN